MAGLEDTAASLNSGYGTRRLVSPTPTHGLYTCRTRTQQRSTVGMTYSLRLDTDVNLAPILASDGQVSKAGVRRSEYQVNGNLAHRMGQQSEQVASYHFWIKRRTISR
jgi:hypothetical protein